MKIKTKTKEHLQSRNGNVSVRKRARGITLIALGITTIFCYDEFIKSSNNKGSLLQTI